MTRAFRAVPVVPERTAREASRDARAAEAPSGLSAAAVLHLQVSAGNRAVGRLLSEAPRAVARRPPAEVATEEAFNPESIVHDLRRAIDVTDTTVRQKAVKRDGPAQMYSIPEWESYRNIDADLVIRVLDNLTTSQVATVREVYSRQNQGRSLEKDLFEGGESGNQSGLKESQKARIKALLLGTRAADAGGATTWGRLEADVAELQSLILSKVLGDMPEATIERIMALYRRPKDEIERIERIYETRYSLPLYGFLAARLKGQQRIRLTHLREGNTAQADAAAIEAKRQAIVELDAKPFESWERDSFGKVYEFRKKEREEQRQKLIGGIEAVVETNRQEALADRANAGRSSSEAVRDRLNAILAVQGSEAGTTLKGELAKTLGSDKGAVATIAAMAGGSLIQAAAQQMLDMEASGTIKADKIAPLLRGLRTQATRDIQAQVMDARVPQAEKEAIASNAEAAVDTLAKRYTRSFIDTYEDLRSFQHRSWDRIVAAADDENQPMLKALVDRGGRMEDIEELEFAVARKNADRIKAVLRKQATQQQVQDLVTAYEAKHGAGSLRRTLFGLKSDEWKAATTDKYFTGAMLGGRDAAHATESLDKPSQLGGDAEVDWIAKHGQRELEVTEANQGLTGELREWGDDPETQELMNESAKQLKQLQREWSENDPWGRPRPQILAEMRRVRATLTGDATAYEEENEQLLAQIRSAVSFAVQIALALALPGVGSGFIATMALNIGTNVAANMVIWGEKYTLASFRNDVVGGLVGGVGGKFGEEALGALASKITSKSVNASAAAAERAGLATALAREAGEATVTAAEQTILTGLAREGGNILGGAAGSTVATGENAFTGQGLLENAFMNIVGKFAPGARPKPGAGAASGDGAPPPHVPPPGAESVRPAGGEPAAPAADGGTRPPAAEPTRPPAAEPVRPAVPDQPGRPVDAAPDAVVRPGGSSDAAVPTRAGSAAERLEVRRLVHEVEALAAHWPSMSVKQREDQLTPIANRVLQVRGVPEARVVSGEVSAGNTAEFDHKRWAVVLRPDVMAADVMPPGVVSMVSELSRHEVDHALQFWAMARLKANEGWEPARIQVEMDGISLRVARSAVESIKTDGPMSAPEVAAAQVFWNSLFGTESTVRNYNLNQRREHRERLQAIEEQIRAAAAPDPALVKQRDDLKLVVEGFDKIYRGLPEEVPAYQQSAIVVAEARLLEAERKLDMAQIAVTQFTGVVKRVEDRILADIAAGRDPDPRMTADHGRGLERLKQLEQTRDAAQQAVDAAAQAAGGGAGGGTPAGPGGGGTAPGGPPGSSPPGSTPPGTTGGGVGGSSPGTPVTRQGGPGGGTPAHGPVDERGGTQPPPLDPAAIQPGQAQAPVRGQGHPPAPQTVGAPPTERLAPDAWTATKADDAGGINTGKLYLFEHASGTWWLFKPAASEARTSGEDLGIVAQDRYRRSAAAADLGHRLGIETPGVRLVEYNGQVGSLQQWRGDLTAGSNVHRSEAFKRFWDSQQRKDLDAFDYLIANQDRHPGNYMLDMRFDPPRAVPIDQDVGFPGDPRRGYRMQESDVQIGGDRQYYVRDLPLAISADLADRLRFMHENFPEAKLREWLTQQEVDGVRSRLGVLITKLGNGQLRVVPAQP